MTDITLRAGREPDTLPPPQRFQYRQHIAVLLTLCSLATGVYLNTLDAEFVFDDHHEVVENASIRRLSNVGAVLAHKIARPLTNLSYAVDYARSGLNPHAYHVTNIGLHALNVCLLYFIVSAVTCDWSRRRDPFVNPLVTAVSAAALFAVHPLMTEAVAGVASRSELLVTACFLAAFLAGRRALLLQRWRWIAATWLLLLLALAAKEQAVVFPAMLWLQVVSGLTAV